MILNKDKGLKIADFLLQIKAVKLQPAQPFTWASGWSSPIYCDNRVTLSYPQIRTAIRQTFSELIREKYPAVEVVAGVATGGIAIGALVAEELGLPFIYVRSSSKGHGLGNQIEGHYEENSRTVVIEDLISTGESSLNAIDSLRKAEVNVLGLAAIFTYGFPKSVDNFKKSDCPFFTLSNYDLLLEQAVKSDYISENDLMTLNEWRTNPKDWKINGN